jgi:hypothetical protein
MREGVHLLPLFRIAFGEDPYKSGRTLLKLYGSILDHRYFSSGRMSFDSEISTVMSGGIRSFGIWTGTMLKKLALAPSLLQIHQHWSHKHTLLIPNTFRLASRWADETSGKAVASNWCK